MSKPRTPRAENRFREREFARAGRVAKAIGAQRVEVDPATGRFIIIFGGNPGESVKDNEVESWLGKQKGKHEDQR